MTEVKIFHRCLVCDFIHPEHSEDCPIPNLIAKQKGKGKKKK